MLRHSWDEVPSDWAGTTTSGVPFTVRCQRCGTERRDLLGRNTGELVARRYIYAEGYHINSGDEGLPNIYDFRLDWIRVKANQVKRKKR